MFFAKTFPKVFHKVIKNKTMTNVIVVIVALIIVLYCGHAVQPKSSVCSEQDA